MKTINSKFIIHMIFGIVFIPNILLAYNFCDTQPAGGDTNWDIRDNGSATIPFNLTAGDVWTSIEQVSSVRIVGRHQYSGDLAAELRSPSGTNVILFRLGDGRYGEGASRCNGADFNLMFSDTASGTDLSVADENNYCIGTNSRSSEGVPSQPYSPNLPNVGNSPALQGTPLTYNSQGLVDNKLSNLVGDDPLGGTWGLYVEDAYASDIGTLDEVCIDMDFGSVTYDIWVSKNPTCTDKIDTETFLLGENVYVCYEVSNKGTQDFIFQSETNNHNQTLSSEFTGLYENEFTGTTTERFAYRTFVAGSTDLPLGTNIFTGSITVEGSDSFFSTGETLTTDENITIIVVKDTDSDGVADYIDIDDDNDGILDTVENNGIDPTTDADGDGISQYLDLDDNDATVGADPNNIPNIDTDGDNIPNHLDIDADGDGIPDNVEAQDTIDYILPSGTVNAEGLDIAYEDTNGITPQDTDGDSTPDYFDFDSDNDNVPDVIEGHDFDHDGSPDDVPTGQDTDNDGLDDGFEGIDIDDPYDVNDEIETPLIDLPDTDFDAAQDGDVDYRDTDDDNDGEPTIDEDNDDDGNYANDDCDEDEIPDYLDVDTCEIDMPDGFSPNGDNENDVFEVDGLTNLYPNFTLEIYDRYGNIVYEYTHNGDKNTEPVWWNGLSSGRWTLNKDQKVPVGTYFYVLYPNRKGYKAETGWLYINE